MSTKKIRFLYLVLVVSLLAMNSCTPKIDADLVGQASCSPPCWMGIQPGVTNDNKAIEILENLKPGENGHLIDSPNGIEWQAGTGKSYSLSVNGNLISTIEMRVDSATIASIIKLFGKPDYFLVDSIQGDAYTILLLYPKKGLVFRAGINSHAKMSLEPAMRVIHAVYFKPGKLSDALEAVYGSHYDEIVLKYVHEWEGYGEITP
jgi:hypothetical protein